uniref:Leucine-rich repeat-containing N-terminal plant-type domain-containing protein n=1 Tax=Nicotiana tabacum TaxID=4097 RepID=A0A1S4DE35_TOBAC|nr:PREDICTED: uncharacterized protein LOC107828830 [Nicotiana tabacum]
MQGDSEGVEVNRSLTTRELKLQLLKFYLTRSQHRMVDKESKNRTDRQFHVRNWVYLKIQPYRQLYLSSRHFNKLSSKYYGPYQILERIGNVAYKLAYKLALSHQLPIHPTFHVSLLKIYYEVPTSINHPPVLDLSNPYCTYPAKILERRIVQKGNKAAVQFLTQWEHLPEDQATREDSNALKTGDALNSLKTNLADPISVLQRWDPTLVNPCTWFHVICNLENSVTRVDLGNANLSGQLVPQLGQLQKLQYFFLCNRVNPYS